MRDLFSSRIANTIKKFRNGSDKIKEDTSVYPTDKIPKWIKQIAEGQESLPESEEFLDDLKTDFFNYRLFVFTPKGDVIDLPVDSSVIDFAYAIHSDVGNHLSGGKVNGKFVAIDTKLNKGDIVDIETRESSHPTAKWLNHTKTSVAQRNIRNIVAEKN